MIRLILVCFYFFLSFLWFPRDVICWRDRFTRFERLLDVCHGQRTEREGQLVLFLVFEHLEQDLSGYIESLPGTGMPAKTIQVCLWFFIYNFSNWFGLWRDFDI